MYNLVMINLTQTVKIKNILFTTALSNYFISCIHSKHVLVHGVPKNSYDLTGRYPILAVNDNYS